MSFTVKEVAIKVCKAMGVEAKIDYLEERKEVRRAYCSHEKAARVFKAGQDCSIDEGLSKMVEWARRTGSRQRSQFNAVEVRKGMPMSWR